MLITQSKFKFTATTATSQPKSQESREARLIPNFEISISIRGSRAMDPDMEQYRVDVVPHGLYYIANFLSPEEEQSLLDKVETRIVQMELT